MNKKTTKKHLAEILALKITHEVIELAATDKLPANLTRAIKKAAKHIGAELKELTHKKAEKAKPVASSTKAGKVTISNKVKKAAKPAPPKKVTGSTAKKVSKKAVAGNPEVKA